MKVLKVDCISLKGETPCREPFFTMRDGKVEPADKSAAWMVKDGIEVPDGETMRTLHPKDGLAFMEGLSRAFHGTYFHATKPYEAEEGGAE